jgi:hypothetical protein
MNGAVAAAPLVILGDDLHVPVRIKIRQNIGDNVSDDLATFFQFRAVGKLDSEV